MTTIIKEEELENINIKESDKTEKKLTKDLKDSEVVVVLNNDTTSYVTAKIISNEKIDNTTYQYIAQALNTTKTTVGLIKTNTDPNLLNELSTPIETERVVLNEEKKELGKLIDVLDAGSSDIFRIALNDGRYALISNNKNHVLEINTNEKYVLISEQGLVYEDL